MPDAPSTSDPAKRHSAALTDGPDRAGARAMLKAIGFTDEDLAKPIIGVATTWIETMPCNLNQRHLAEFVKAGIRAAGGTPMEFNTIAISDGVTMGTEGMKTVARQPRGHRRLDRARRARPPVRRPRVPRRLRQDRSRAAAMALGRLDIPGIVLYSGTIYPGVYKGQRNATVVTVFEAIGAYRAGRITLDELYEIENAACPGPGACGGQFTANTMSTVMEFIGLSPAGLNGIPAEDPAKDAAAQRTGELVMDLVRRDVRPSSIVTRAALENGIASVAATGGSTNGVLHLLAIAHEYGIPLDIDEFGDIADRTPIVADMQPGGRFTATDMYDAGGVALVMRELLKRPGLLHGDAMTVDGRTIAQIAGGRPRDARPAGRRPARDAAQADRRPGHPARLAGARWLRRQAGRPRAPAASRPRPRVRFGGGLLRGGPRPADQAGRRGRDPLRGPGRRAGHAGDAAGDGGARRRGSRRLGRAADRRPVLGRHARADDRPRGAGGGARRSDRDRRGGRHDRHRRRSQGARPGLAAGESERRFARWAPPGPRYRTGVMAKYAALVGTASEGAVTTGSRMSASLARR